jgi:hypothetical protein
MPPEQTKPYESYASRPQTPGLDGRKKLFVLGGLVLAFLAIITLFLLFTGSTKIVVNVSGNGSGQITYRFVNQINQEKVVEVKNASKHLEQKLPRGTYELTVAQDKSSSFSVIDGTGSGATVNVTPQPERGRTFVGNQPRDCMYFLNKYLVSYGCGQSVGDMQTHMPATANETTFAKPNPVPTEDVVEGLIKTNEGDVLIVYEAEIAGHEGFDTDEGPKPKPHIGFVVKDGRNLTLENGVELEGLEKDLYSFQSYRGGFIAYNKTFTQANYYASLRARPVKLTVNRPANSSLTAYDIATRDQAFVIAYAQPDQDKESELVLQDGNQTKHYKFEKKFSSIRLCGKKKLCAIGGSNLEVYDISGEESRLAYTVNNVQAIDSLDNHLLVIREKDVLALDVDNQGGHTQYAFGNYGYCGVQTTDDTYLLCVANSRGGKAVLYLEQQRISDDIDKKVAELLKLPAVSTVSVYGKFITVAPNAGKVEFQKELNRFGYNPDIVKTVNAQVGKKIREIGFDQNHYQIRNTLE